MSKQKLLRLGLAVEKAQDAVKNKPETSCPEQLVFSRDTGLYYVPGPRRNAQVYCTDVAQFRTSARYNDELTEAKGFILLAKIEQLLAGVKQ